MDLRALNQILSVFVPSNPCT